MNQYSGRVKRDLSERRFSKANADYCCTGGSNLGCPFLRTNKLMEKICALYRAKPKLVNYNQYNRVISCIENACPPTIKNYKIHASRNIFSTSKEEAGNCLTKLTRRE